MKEKVFSVSSREGRRWVVRGKNKIKCVNRGGECESEKEKCNAKEEKWKDLAKYRGKKVKERREGARYGSAGKGSVKETAAKR